MSTSSSRPTPRSTEARTIAPTRACASRNGTPCSHQPLGEVDRGRRAGRRPPPACAPARARRSRGARPSRRQREPVLVERVEQRLLVLLQVAVVGERQALERGEEPGEVADQAAGLAAGELGDVGVLLLRQHRRAGAVRIGEPEEAELLAATTARSPRRDATGAPA